MRTIAKTLLCILAFVAGHASTGWACSFSTEPMITFLRDEYVFFGEVTGFVGPIKSSRVLEDAWGLKVRVSHGFNLPNRSGDYFEVYPLGLTNACEKTGTSQEALNEFYPPGSKVRVVGMKAVQFDSIAADGTIRLSLTEMNGGLVARNDLNDGFDSTVKSVYDYKKDKTHTRSAQDQAAVYYYYSWLGDFELRKDLIRLQNSTKESERYAILKRLSDYSYYHIDYERLVKNHIQNRKLINQLLRLRPT